MIFKESQYILWKKVPRPDGRTDKIPISPRTMMTCDAQNPHNWTDYLTVKALADATEFGIGFVFTAALGIAFIDIDHCKLPTGEWNPVAATLMDMLPGACIELSQSEEGLHIFAKYSSLPEHGVKGAGFDLFTDKRFVALTENVISGDAYVAHTGVLSAIAASIPKGVSFDPENWTTEPCEDWAGPSDNAELIKRARRSKSVSKILGAKASFKDLWDVNVDVLSEQFPADSPDRNFDASSADAALAQHLAFWTGKNGERVKEIMLTSGLYRSKYDREDYLPRTITKAITIQADVYREKASIERLQPTTGTQPATGAQPVPEVKTGNLNVPEVKSGHQFSGVDHQLELFKSCAYIIADDVVFTPAYGALNRSRFNAAFGGYEFDLSLGSSKSTKSAWDAFTTSQLVCFPKAHAMEFDPSRATGHIREEGGRKICNNYISCGGARTQGDPSRFLNHMNKLFPDEHDLQIILGYVAAIVQHPGVKFQWSPVVQGVQGNGKSFLSRILLYAVGFNHSHMARTDDLTSQFNAWLEHKVFIGFEDVQLKDALILERIKPYITGEMQPVEGKGANTQTKNICANFIFNCNSKQAIRKSKGDRRFSIFYTPQQKPEDLERDGMGGDYFPKLYDWCKKENGYGIIADFLDNYTIPDKHNPAIGATRAPRTTSVEEALNSSFSLIAQTLQEASEEELIGFRGGWMSSKRASAILKEAGVKFNYQQLAEAIMSELEYIQHPYLTKGRARCVVPAEGGKPVLYIRPSAVTDVGDPTETYSKEQGYGS